MFITTYTRETSKAAVRSSATGRVLYTATCTESEEAAARAVVRKHWPEPVVATVREVRDPDEIRAISGGYMDSPQRKAVARFWAFDPKAS